MRLKTFLDLHDKQKLREGFGKETGKAQEIRMKFGCFCFILFCF